MNRRESSVSDLPVLQVKGLSKSFLLEDSLLMRVRRTFSRQSAPRLTALNNLCFSVKQGETLGVLGESGSGKSTLARVLMGIYEPDNGSAQLLGREIINATGSSRLAVLRDMQMVFQDPFASLDPRMNVRQIISEPLQIHRTLPCNDREALLVAALAETGLGADALNRYPSEFSGGQRQRIGICRALILKPKLIIADEAVSALDVSVQAQILELLMRLRVERGLSMIFISHDVAVVRQIADRIILLYHGNLVEEISADNLLSDAKHPYTRRLLDSALFLREGGRAGAAKITRSLFKPENGACCFLGNCPAATEQCLRAPVLRELSSTHKLACWNR